MNGLHYPEKNEKQKADSKRAIPTRKCYVCKIMKASKGKSTSYHCGLCKVNLCIDCFKTYHEVTKVDYFTILQYDAEHNPEYNPQQPDDDNDNDNDNPQ